MTFGKSSAIALLAAVGLLFSIGCANSGKVEQGRAVAFDKQKGEVTLILDSAPKSDQPKYDVLPPVVVMLPQNPGEIGALPEAGKLLVLDTKNRQVTFFDQGSATVRTVSYATIEQHDDVAKDDPRVAKAKLPLVDRQKKTVTVYSRRKKILLTFTVPDEYLALPDDTWKSGDEIRYYYKQPGQALRLMNVSKTDLSKGEK